jgi:DNA-binding response OmpR family regulator
MIMVAAVVPPVQPATMKTSFKSNDAKGEIQSSEGQVNVWLIEDNHRFRQTVARMLCQVDGFECTHQFSNAEDALDALAGGGVPDVVLLDVELPGQDGIEAVRNIKSICPSTHVLMLTVFDDHDKVFKAVCAGASGYLLKVAAVDGSEGRLRFNQPRVAGAGSHDARFGKERDRRPPVRQLSHCGRTYSKYLRQTSCP